MQPSFSIDVDTSRNLVLVTLAGFFASTDIAAFRTARDEAHRALTCRRNQHLTIVDIRDMKIQSQESVTAFRAMLSEPRYHARRIAIVVASSLARSQIRRAAEGRDAGYFDSREQAEAWLLDEALDAA